MPNIAITGAGSGLGRALAHHYAKEGYTVFLLGRTDKKLHIVQHEIVSSGGESIIVSCDVREPASVGIAFQQIGELDIFIANAGVGSFHPVENYSLKDIDNVINTNIKGTILTTQAAIPLIKPRNGHILTIISTAGLRGKVNESVYCASKFAVKGFTESLQKEWEQESMYITGVYMGGMNTPFWHEETHVSDPSQFKDPVKVAEQIFNEDDGRREIFIDH